MDFTQEQIARLAKLSGLAVTPEVLETGGSLASVVAFVDQIQGVDPALLEGIEPTDALIAPLREDVVAAGRATSDELLACSPKKIVSHHIAVDNIFRG